MFYSNYSRYVVATPSKDNICVLGPIVFGRKDFQSKNGWAQLGIY